MIGTTEVSGSSGDGGPATKSLADLNSIYAVAVDISGNIYIADTCYHIIRKITKDTGYISSVAGMT